MDGIVENADNLQVGQMAVTGLGMLSLVHSQSAWVEANFKEKDVGRMVRASGRAIEVDAYPGRKFTAHVQSVGAGTGGEFSLLPAQNANGNWVKVTQRVPVRVAFNGTPRKPMIAGLSVDRHRLFRRKRQEIDRHGRGSDRRRAIRCRPAAG